MNLSLWGIRHPLAAGLLFAVLCFIGLFGFRQLPIASLPDIALPTVQVTVTLPGATPAQLETDVTRRIEDAVASLSEIDKIVSAVSEGSSVTRIEFELGRDINEALDEVRDAVEPGARRPAERHRGAGDRPAEPHRRRPCSPTRSSPTGWRRTSCRWFVDDVVTKALFGVSGVGQVSRTGGVEREVLRGRCGRTRCRPSG